MTTPSTRPVTRDEKENSKKEFDDLTFLINQELRGLEGWLLKTATPKLTNLSKLLTGNLGNADKRWECEAEIRIVKTYTKQGQTKIDYVESLIGKLNEQVLRAPIKVKEADEDTSKSRLYKAREVESKFEDNREAFDRWTSWCMKIQANFRELTDIKTPIREDTGDPEDKEKRGPREDKGSTPMQKVSNQMSLKPPCPG